MNIRIKKKFSREILKTGGMYSFLNLSSIGAYLDSGVDVSKIQFFCDGMLLSSTVSVLKLNRVSRVSFDFTSIAHDVLNYAEKNSIGVIFVGATESEAHAFENKLKHHYKNLDVFVTSGYFDNAQLELIKNKLARENNRVVIAGLGAPKQDLFIQSLFLEYPEKTYFTCGGFIRQESSKTTDYYPYFINKTRTRAFYRMYCEPHTIRRYFFDYPRNLMKLVYLHFSKNIFKVID